MKELFFSGAITKVTATGVSLDKFETSGATISSNIKAISSDMISTLKNSGIISSNDDLVKKSAGTVIGSKLINYKCRFNL